MKEARDFAHEVLVALVKAEQIELSEHDAVAGDIGDVLAESFAFAAAVGDIDLQQTGARLLRVLFDSDGVAEIFADDEALLDTIGRALRGSLEPAAPVARSAAPTPETLAARYGGNPRDEDLHGALRRAEAWLSEVRRIASEALTRLLPASIESIVGVNPAARSEAELAELAQHVGCQTLPPSLSAFLQHTRGVVIEPTSESVAVSVEGCQRFTDKLQWWLERHRPVASGRPEAFEVEIEIDAERTILVGGRDGEYNYFVNLTEADAAGEAPVYRFYHDDASLYWQAHSFEQHFSAMVSRAIGLVTETLEC